ncbi:hypothetical protein LUZ61_011913 [Rhynchospora tenuis]|uniref:KIB1-4 beta-propeller domain-containing protein n=1 Tax=Rhynchospora tenuis TaxID=198213 RepID=A0AAD6F107_9POAL|nr:hypothetical protein LUZ61_011913 [Rhynchospora tenuis]
MKRKCVKGVGLGQSTSELPDWADLPGLAVHLISKKVTSIVDYVLFRAVCSSWRSASLPKPCHLPPQLPWLMIQHKMDEGIGLFYDVWESKMRKLPLPETIHMSCLTSCHGWLFLVSTRGPEVFLLNPLTRARIPLPPFRFSNDDFKHLTVKKVTSSTDLTDPNCLIMVFHHDMTMIHICRVGESSWTDITGGPLHCFNVIYDATYYNGRLYLLYQGAMEIVESNKPEERTVYYFEPELLYLRMCFLEGKAGVYVVASRLIVEEVGLASHDTNKVTVKTLMMKIKLYQFQEWSYKLKLITDTDNTAIFSGMDNFCLAVCTDDWDLADHVGGNYMDVIVSLATSYYKVLSTKLDNGKSEVLCNLDAEHHIKWLTWFQPSFD